MQVFIILLMLAAVVLAVIFYTFLTREDGERHDIVDGVRLTPPPTLQPRPPPLYDTFLPPPPPGLSRMEFLRYFDRMHGRGRHNQNRGVNRHQNRQPEREPDFGYGSAELLNIQDSAQEQQPPPSYHEATSPV